MGSVDEETIKASLARINAGLQSAGSPKVFEQYQHGVYLNQPFGALSTRTRSRMRWARDRDMLGLSRTRAPIKTINFGSGSSSPTRLLMTCYRSPPAS